MESYWNIDLIPLLSCEVITSIWMLQRTPKYFFMFKMEPFHLIISAIFSPACVLLSPQNWTNLEPSLISWLGFVVIADTCKGRWLIDWSDSAARIQTLPFPPVMSQRRRQVQRPRSASLRPAITQRCTPQLCSAAQWALLVFVNGITPDSTQSCVLNWDSSDFNDPIGIEPFIEDFRFLQLWK